MQWNFQFGGQSVALTPVQDAIAVQPRDAVRSSHRGAALARVFSASAVDDAGAGKAGLSLPARDRAVFERAGWVFVQPREALTRAAEVRAETSEALAVRQPFLDQGGNLLVVTDRVVVQLDAALSEAQALSQLQADELMPVRRLAFEPNLYEARILSPAPLDEALYRLQHLPAPYLFVEPALLEVMAGRMKPTDPDYPLQWQHTSIQSELAWDRTRGREAGGRAVRIAVIDNGMQVKHPDLKQGLVGGGRFLSDGLGGAVFQSWLPDAGGSFPGGDHGTFCLGMAGARMNNNRGGCGSAPEAELLAFACAPDQVGTQATLARAVACAADPRTEDPASTATGADVVVSSLGPNGAVWNLSTALDRALRRVATQGRGGKGVPVLWAASNGHVLISLDRVCSHSGVIAVARSNRFDLADGAAFGPELEFLAPGVEVYSTRSGSKYGVSTGCSFAAPLAAGVAALVLARHPDWTAAQVRQRLRDACDKVGSAPYVNGRNNDYGFGRLSAARAVA